ncbi:hypothetical protein [Streptomyces sp. NPDC002994]|uniref:hypothetical protein n=1 Tax=Streptomyces sp. NPDC002994 TaxID=3154441 RepID=UPI0033A8F4AF
MNDSQRDSEPEWLLQWWKSIGESGRARMLEVQDGDRIPEDLAQTYNHAANHAAPFGARSVAVAREGQDSTWAMPNVLRAFLEAQRQNRDGS